MGRGSYLARTQGGYSRPSSNTQQSRQSQSDSRFGGNIERANTRVVSPKVTPQVINRDNEKDDTGAAEAVKQFRVKTEHGTFANQAAADAYETSLKQQERMRQAIAMAYDGSTSNFQNLNKEQKQELIDSGFAAAESSGVLGGTFGAEIVSNQLKQALADAKTYAGKQNAIAALDRLHGSKAITDAMYSMGLLNPDQSATYSFASDIDRYEGGTYLKDAFYNMQSPNLTPKDYTNYMNQISAFGHSPQKSFGGSGGGGGYGYGYGGGGGSGGGGGYMYDMGGGFPQTYQRGQVGPGSLQEQVNQAYLSGGKGFSRGGIVSLLRL